MKTHKTTKVRINGSDVAVDSKLANLVTFLNDKDFQTFNSCEDNFGDVWLEFDMLSAHALMEAVLKEAYLKRNSDPTVYHFFHYLQEQDWKTSYDETFEVIGDDKIQGGGELITFISLRFLKEDLGLVEKELRRILHND